MLEKMCCWWFQVRITPFSFCVDMPWQNSQVPTEPHRYLRSYRTSLSHVLQLLSEKRHPNRKCLLPNSVGLASYHAKQYAKQYAEQYADRHPNYTKIWQIHADPNDLNKLRLELHRQIFARTWPMAMSSATPSPTEPNDDFDGLYFRPS